jgi:hypothetical protein
MNWKRNWVFEAPTAYPQKVEVVAKPRLACPSWHKLTATAFIHLGELPRPRWRNPTCTENTRNACVSGLREKRGLAGESQRIRGSMMEERIVVTSLPQLKPRIED